MNKAVVLKFLSRKFGGKYQLGPVCREQACGWPTEDFKPWQGRVVPHIHINKVKEG